MKIMAITKLIDAGGFSKTLEWRKALSDVKRAIMAVQWPPDSGSFTLHDQSGKGRGEGSGVKPIKNACMAYLKARPRPWKLNKSLPLTNSAKQPGPVDASFEIGKQHICLEWETGNISSSHRAINKMALGMVHGRLLGGILILPTRKMYRYLTDRVGNYEELAPYFSLWGVLPVKKGTLAVIAIEHDAVSKSVPRIPKGTDGRALL